MHFGLDHYVETDHTDANTFLFNTVQNVYRLKCFYNLVKKKKKRKEKESNTKQHFKSFERLIDIIALVMEGFSTDWSFSLSVETPAH